METRTLSRRACGAAPPPPASGAKRLLSAVHETDAARSVAARAAASAGASPPAKRPRRACVPRAPCGMDDEPQAAGEERAGRARAARGAASHGRSPVPTAAVPTSLRGGTRRAAAAAEAAAAAAAPGTACGGSEPHQRRDARPVVRRFIPSALHIRCGLTQATPQRLPGGRPEDSPRLRDFLARLRRSSPTLGDAAGRVMRLKRFVSADARPAVIDAVLDALAQNTRVQARFSFCFVVCLRSALKCFCAQVLYIQNFEKGFGDAQLEKLTGARARLFRVCYAARTDGVVPPPRSGAQAVPHLGGERGRKLPGARKTRAHTAPLR